jgi:tRNA threonylcarbamoyladenosine biosynthesis protein TsaE
VTPAEDGTAFEARDAEATRALGEALGLVVEPGDVILLSGDLGAGKTTLVQGLARGLSVSDAVQSPTFTFVHLHEGRVPLAHVDLYRIGDAEELADLGLDDLLYGDGVAAVEWGERFLPYFAQGSLDITLSYPPAGEEGRQVTVCARGERAELLLARWTAR